MINFERTKIQLAHEFARLQHTGQVRKYTGESYITHPIAVTELVSQFVQDEDVLCAALLHDVVEDTPTTIEEIEEKFGPEIACYVWYLTKPPSFVGNRDERKQLDRDRLQQAPKLARLIKVFDLWHNAGSIQEHDPKFWVTFKQEALLLLDSMMAYDVVCEFCGEDFAQSEFQEFVRKLA